jgi:hypothetical protein
MADCGLCYYSYDAHSGKMKNLPGELKILIVCFLWKERKEANRKQRIKKETGKRTK